MATLNAGIEWASRDVAASNIGLELILIIIPRAMLLRSALLDILLLPFFDAGSDSSTLLGISSIFIADMNLATAEGLPLKMSGCS